MNRVPDFIIAGAAKCGTTALAHFLSQVPGVYMSKNKEPRFFTRLKGEMEKGIAGDGPRLSGNYDKGFGWYEKLFEESKPHQLKAEASTVYFCNEDSSALIYECNPSVKLIFMLRNPIDRIYSHYWQEYKLGFDFPSFEEMVETDNPRFLYYKKISSYKKNLSRFLELFKADQIHIIIQEEFEKNTEKHFENVLEFLGLDLVKIDLNKRVNDQITPKNRKIARALTSLQVSRLRKILPTNIIKSAGRLRIKLFRANAKPFKYPPLSKEIYNRLSKHFESDISFVEHLLGRQIDSWNMNTVNPVDKIDL